MWNFNNLLQTPTCLFEENMAEGILQFHEIKVSQQTSYIFEKMGGIKIILIKNH